MAEVQGMTAGDCEPISRPDIWHSLRKIRAAVYRVGFNFNEIFKSLEPEGKLLTPEQKFLSVFCGPLKGIIGLSDREITQISDYFRVYDGRINYDQFCRTIHGDPTKEEMEEKDDPMKTNPVLPREEKQIKGILARLCRNIEKPLILRPQFQEYEMLKSNSGVVTISGFFRVLSSLDFQLSSFERNLLIKKYSRDIYTMRYAGFINDLTEMSNYLLMHPGESAYDPHGNLPLNIYRPLNLNEIGIRKIYLSKRGRGALTADDIIGIFTNLKNHVINEKIHLMDFFRMYDTQMHGRVDEWAFKEALEWMKYSRKTLVDIYLSSYDIKTLCDMYRDPEDPEQILYKVFVDDILSEVDEREVAKWPHTPLEPPAIALIDRLPRIPDQKVEQVFVSKEVFFDDIRRKMKHSGVNPRRYFVKHDPEQKGRVPLKDFLDIICVNGLISDLNGLNFIQEKYMSDGMIDYMYFIKDMTEEEINDSQTLKSLDDIEKTMNLEKEKEKFEREKNIIEILAKIKNKLICCLIRMLDKLSPLDENKIELIPWSTFKNVLEETNFNLTPLEYETIHDVFRSDNDSNLIEYTLFTRTVDDESIRPCLTRLPLKEAMEQVRSKPPEPVREFVNFENRQLLTQAMKRLSRLISLGKIDQFKSCDVGKTGTVDRSTFLHLLFKMNVLHVLTIRELDAIMVGFGRKRDGLINLDYTSFLYALDMVYRRDKADAMRS